MFNGHNCTHMYLVNLIEGIALKPSPTNRFSSTTPQQQQQNNITDHQVLFNEAATRLQNAIITLNQQVLLNSQYYDPDSANVINDLAEQLTDITGSLRRHKRINMLENGRTG